MILTAPYFLSIGIGVAALVLLAGWSQAGRRRRLAAFLGGVAAGTRLSSRPLQRIPWGRMVLLVLAALAVGVSAADPRRRAEVGEPVPPPPIRNFLLALDASASMQATDLPPTRLGRAVALAEAILERVPNDRVGLLLFAGSAYPIAPPTRDHDALRYLLSGVVPTIASAHDPGTLLTAGIEGGVRLLEGTAGPGEERILVLIGDGEAGDAEGAFRSVAEEAASGGVVLHAIGVGTEAGSRVVLPAAPYQLGGVVVDEARRPVISRLDRAPLSTAATTGGGVYVDAMDPQEVEAFLEQLEREPPAEDPQDGADATERALWPGFALAALFLLFAEGLFDLRLPGRMARLARTVQGSGVEEA